MRKGSMWKSLIRLITVWLRCFCTNIKVIFTKTETETIKKQKKQTNKSHTFILPKTINNESVIGLERYTKWIRIKIECVICVALSDIWFVGYFLLYIYFNVRVCLVHWVICGFVVRPSLLSTRSSNFIYIRIYGSFRWICDCFAHNLYMATKSWFHHILYTHIEETAASNHHQH